MKVNYRPAHIPTLRAAGPFQQPADSSPQETYASASGKGDSKLPLIGMGLATGAIGVGVPGALAIGALKSLVTGHALLFTGLTVAAVGVGVLTVPMSFMGAAMSTDAGSTAGLNAYFVGAGLSLGAAALSIF